MTLIKDINTLITYREPGDIEILKTLVFASRPWAFKILQLCRLTSIVRINYENARLGLYYKSSEIKGALTKVKENLDKFKDTDLSKMIKLLEHEISLYEIIIDNGGVRKACELFLSGKGLQEMDEYSIGIRDTCFVLLEMLKNLYQKRSQDQGIEKLPSLKTIRRLLNQKTG